MQFRGVDTASLADHVRRVSVLDRECMRTSESLVTAAKHFVADGRLLYDEVMHVTSKNHIARVLRDATAIWWEKMGLAVFTSGYPAQTGYAGGLAGEMSITELTPRRQAAREAERQTESQS